MITLSLAVVLAMVVLASGHAQPLVQRQLGDSVHAELDCSACHPKGTEPQQTGTVEIDDRACTGCHESAEPYWKSAHGRARSAGVAAAPTCVDCHGSHAIEPVSAKTSPVYPTNLPKTCGQCHQNSELSEAFGVPAQRYTSYMDSYHGVLLSEGNLIAANCTSCHGHHLILAQSNPESSIHPSNLPGTCGQCHPNAGETFTRGEVHVDVEPGESTGVWIVRVFYTVLIGVLGVFFIGHILLDATRWLRRRYGN